MNDAPIERIAGNSTAVNVRTFDPAGAGVYTVRAFDAAGNQSSVLASVTVDPVSRPRSAPHRIPKWAWALLAWEQNGSKGTRPSTEPAAEWFADWKTMAARTVQARKLNNFSNRSERFEKLPG